MRRLLAASVCTVAFALFAPLPVLTALAPQRASAAPAVADETSFVGHINALRASKGLGSLQVSGELTAVARGWSAHMAAAGSISHNPGLANSVSAHWVKLGENVGVGYDVDSLWQAFVHSPAHYANLIDPDFGFVGVGDVWAADGRLFTTHDFMALAGSPPPPTTPPPTASPSGGTTNHPAATRQPSQPSAAPAPAPAPPPPPPPPPAAPKRVSTVLVALHVLHALDP
jgi:Cysteine-rich secretory protein family